MRLAAFLLVSALIASEPPKIPEPFRSVADLAAAAPPEFTADALLRIVESGKLADSKARRELVEQAFRAAASAKFPIRMEGLPGTIADTASGSLSQAYSLKLDAQSLQSRAVQDMLPLDPPRAREMFAEMVRPSLTPLTCDDALVYEPSAFYQALSAVANSTAFTPKEKAKEEHVNFVADYLGQASSPSQIAPLARVVQSASVTDAQRAVLKARLDALVESLQLDDRSASAALPGLSNSGLEAFADKIRQKSHGCEGDAVQPPGAQPAKKARTPKLDTYWQSTSSQQVLQAGRKLRFSSNSQLLTESDRTTPEWQQQLADYLNLTAGWSSDQEASEAVYFHERCQAYTALIELVPSGAQSEKILADYVDFIANSGLYQQSPAEWYWEAHTVLERALTNATQRVKILEAFQRCGNPVLALEVALEKAVRVGS